MAGRWKRSRCVSHRDSRRTAARAAGPQILDLLATHVTDLVVEAYDHPKLVIFLSRNDKLACSGTSIKKG
jgi:hypothetical protein